MKILKIFGVVVGIHVAALVLIFASPGCSSANKSAPADTVIKKDDTPSATVSLPPSGSSAVSPVSIAGGDTSPVSGASMFDPNAPATSSPTVRFSPTRPGTPAAGALETQPVADVMPASTYTVAKGDSLWTIAKKNHLSVSDLAAANNLKASSTVHVGQKLIVPGGKFSGSAAKTASAALALSTAAATDHPTHAAMDAGGATAARANGESVKHTVKPGETLGAIARKYQVRVGEIATANNITDPAKIRPGMELIIPGWQAPAGKTKSSRSSASSRAAEAAPTIGPSAAPSDQNVVTPAPEQELDAGLKGKTGDAPVIKVDEK